jgi:hypothetical protein
MYRAVGESIRALIELLIGATEPPLGECIGEFVSSSVWLKPVDSIIREELHNIKIQISGCYGDYSSEEEKRKRCLEGDV